ncbi:TetR family transcriptional regulator [Nocardia puris]|uniref:TetR family transcriptional regulator n=2 Tax=Nocardia puris TaxID=208602 RepID=A0A366DNA1_9NOCA|nr:TetR family transcriptional regulator [Nocardia puris]
MIRSPLFGMSWHLRPSVVKRPRRKAPRRHFCGYPVALWITDSADRSGTVGVISLATATVAGSGAPEMGDAMPYVESALRTKQAVAAARAVLIREGVGRTTMRAVATEAGIPLGTLQYVFPSKQGLLQAVIEDVVDEIADVLRRTADTEHGLANAIRHGLRTFWNELVDEQSQLQLLQVELVTHALRTPGLEWLARRQYERYTEVVTEWSREAAHRAGETCAVPFDRLARVVVANIDGLIMQHVVNPDPARSAGDVEAIADMLVTLAGVRPAS